MTMDEAGDKARRRSQGVLLLGICTAIWATLSMVSDYRHGSGSEEWIIGIILVATLLQLWRLHTRFAFSLAESVRDPVTLDRLSAVVSSIEMLVMLAILCAAGIPKVILHPPF